MIVLMAEAMSWPEAVVFCAMFFVMSIIIGGRWWSKDED